MSQTELLRYLQQLPLPEITPKPSNRGVIDPSTPLVFSHLDYIQMTTQAPRQWGKDTIAIPFLSDLLTVASSRHGIRNYRYGANLSPAGTAFWNTNSEERPGLLVLTGSDLGILRAMSAETDDSLLKRLHRAAISFTRVDFASNIDRGDPDEIFQAMENGEAETRVRTYERIQSRKKHWHGYTTYLGSRDSDKYIRCYDKAAELKISNAVLTRIEMQLSNKPANRLVKAMLEHGVKTAGKQAIRDFIRFPKVAWWAEALEGAEVELQLTPAKDTSFARWLMEQVLPAIQKRIESGEEIEAINAFTGALLALHGDLGESDGNQ